MRLTAALWTSVKASKFPYRMTQPEFMKAAGLSKDQFTHFRAVVRDQCALRWPNVSFIPPAGSPEMCDMISHARASLAVHQLPDLDDDAVQYGIRSWLRNRRHEITRHAEERAWRAAFPREQSDLEFEFNLARLQVIVARVAKEAFDSNTGYISGLSQDQRRELTERANALLVEQGMPQLSQQYIFRRLSKRMSRRAFRAGEKMEKDRGELID